MDSYRARLIGMGEKNRLVRALPQLHERKANIHGACIKLLTDNPEFKEAWEDNFKFMDEDIRPHARIFAVSDGGRLSVLYNQLSKTVIVRNCGYYGWVKSIALALASDFFEDYASRQRRYSIHGAFVDLGGRGLALIGPPGMGKTTLTYGLLTGNDANYLADDWFFVRFMGNDAVAYASEKNSYIREDLAKSWPAFSEKLRHVRLDKRGRGVADMKLVLGEGRIRDESVLGAIVLLKRDKHDKQMMRKLLPKEALSFMLKNDFCNPHQLVRTKEKLKLRADFFRELFTLVPVYLLNTCEKPQETLAQLRGISR